MLSMPEEYAVVANPMNKVIRFSIVVTPRLYHGFQLNGFSRSPLAKCSIKYSLSSRCTSSVNVRGISQSTSTSGP